MIDRKMTRAEFTIELMRRVIARVDIVHATDAAVNEAIRAAGEEMASEIRAHWAGLELEVRRMNGERVQ
jgi:hypothetical protein